MAYLLHGVATAQQLLERCAEVCARGDEKEIDEFFAAADEWEAERERRLTAPGALGGAARWYASMGVPVFPCLPDGKRPLFGSVHRFDQITATTCKGKCGRDGHGLHDATTDLERISGWWDEHPQANIGLRTGVHFDVIDVDGPDGYGSLADLLSDGDLVAAEVWAEVGTPRGGRHLYVAPTGDGNAAGYEPGLDYRGVGGYVVAPPSRVNGRRYEWIETLNLCLKCTTPLNRKLAEEQGDRTHATCDPSGEFNR